MNVTINQEVYINEDEHGCNFGTVVKVQKRTCQVEVRGQIRKFVLSDGRESGRGYDCAYMTTEKPHIPF